MVSKSSSFAVGEVSGRRVLSLAIPSALSLAAMPAFMLADSAILGHVGTDELAALGLASTILGTVTGLCVFLAYATTAGVAQAIGGGDKDLALQRGLDGVWLAFWVSVPAVMGLFFGVAPVARLFDAAPEIVDLTQTYVRIAGFGVPAQLMVLAATGTLRGLSDVLTPLWATSTGFAVNIGLNVWFVLGLGWGLAGSAWGTLIAAWFMWAWLMGALGRRARLGAAWRPGMAGFVEAVQAGAPLFVRTVALRLVVLGTALVATVAGSVSLAGFQVVNTVVLAISLVLDGIAIAAQTITGEARGAGAVEHLRQVVRQMTRWGAYGGGAFAVLFLGLLPWLPAWFTPDERVQMVIQLSLLAMVVSLPWSGAAYVLDGVLMGAGLGAELARLQSFLAVIYVPVVAVQLWVLAVWSPSAPIAGVWLWLGWGFFMVLRAILLQRAARRLEL